MENKTYKYTFYVYGWSSEIAFGRISKETWHYIKTKCDGEASTYLEKLCEGEVPEEYDISGGSVADFGTQELRDCGNIDSFFCAYPGSSYITVENEDGGEVLSAFEIDDLVDDGRTKKTKVDIKSRSHFWKFEAEDKGGICSGEFETSKPFDKSKLKVVTEEVDYRQDNFVRMVSLEYDGETIWDLDVGQNEDSDGKSDNFDIY